MKEIFLKRWENKPNISIKSKIDPITLKIIDKATSYKIKNAEHIDNQMYVCPKCGWWKLKIHANSDYCRRCGTQCNEGLWDCIIRLLSKTKNGTYYFPVGLLDIVEDTIKSIGIEPCLLEWPSAPQGSTQDNQLTWSGWTLRSHQDEAMTMALAKLKMGRGCILEMPTGSGKSLLAMRIIRELNVDTLILVHKKNLMEQWNKGIIETLNYHPDLFGDKQKEVGPITIGMIQSIAKSTDFPINAFDLVITDECHHTPADQTYDVVTKSNAYYKFGMSATPKREDGNDLKMVAAIGSIIKVTSIQELIKNGVLAKPTITFINAPPGKGGNTYAEAYKNNITLNTMRNTLIAQKAKELENKGLSVLITITQIRHGKTLESMIKGSKFIHGTTKKEIRQKAMQEFENGTLRVLISTLLNEGTDIPCLDAIILASGGKSESAQIQKVGRALRTTRTKKIALIIDVLDQGKWLRNHAQMRMKLYDEVFG